MRRALVFLSLLAAPLGARAQMGCPQDDNQDGGQKVLTDVWDATARVEVRRGTKVHRSLGVLVKTKTGPNYVVTTRHGLSHDLTGAITVGFDNPDGTTVSTQNASIVMVDNPHDLALLTFSIAATGNPIPFADIDSDDVQLCFVGRRRSSQTPDTTPLQRKQARSYQLSDQLPWSYANNALIQSIPWINMTVLLLAGELEAGTSGGPVVNEQGELVGLAEGGLGGEKSWAIPLDTVKQFVASYQGGMTTDGTINKAVFSAANGKFFTGSGATELGEALGRPRRIVLSAMGAIVPEAPVGQGSIGVVADFLFDVGKRLDFRDRAPFLGVRGLAAGITDGGRQWVAPDGEILSSSPNQWRGMFGAGVSGGGHFRKRELASLDVKVSLDGGIATWSSVTWWFSPTLSFGATHYKDTQARLGFAWEVFGGGIQLPSGVERLDGFGSVKSERAWKPWLGVRFGFSIGL